VHASDAIDEALTGFLAASAKDSAQYLTDPGVPESMREDVRADLATIRNGATLRPDVVVARSGSTAIGGRRLDLHLARDAATAGDVWLYDEATRVAVLGDLATLPAPFLDTACPAGWIAALAELGATPFEVAIPGHGPPLSRAQVERYRDAFAAFLACSATDRPAPECAAQWADSVESLLAKPATEKPRAAEYAEHYVGMLRANGGRSEHCAMRGDITNR
jgi:glyoxylase-like metal-dependent hydrolase (beta-lactamase superfamily II)